MTRVLGFLLLALCLAAVASVSAARIGTHTHGPLCDGRAASIAVSATQRVDVSGVRIG